jgi:serine/threonine protein kinase
MRAGTLRPETTWITARGELRLANPVVEARLRFPQVDARARPTRFDFVTPEAVRADALDVEVDVYGIALTLLTLLLGRSPFLRESSFDTLMAIRDGELSPDELGAIGPSLRATLLRALDPDPKKRPPSPSALAEQLRAALDAEGIAPRTDGLEAWVEGLEPTPCGLSPDARPLSWRALC